jgi:hypothetical protein
LELCSLEVGGLKGEPPGLYNKPANKKGKQGEEEVVVGTGRECSEELTESVGAQRSTGEEGRRRGRVRMLVVVGSGGGENRTSGGRILRWEDAAGSTRHDKSGHDKTGQDRAMPE